MAAEHITTAGLPAIIDGHQFRVISPLRFSGLTEHACRLLLVDDGALSIQDGRNRRMDPPALVFIPPGWPGQAGIGRGAFCYRIDFDGGADLPPLLGGGLRIWSGAQVSPWRGEFISIAQRWWRSQPSRQRTAVHLIDLLLRMTADVLADPAPDSLDCRFQALVRDHLGSEERAPDFARRLGVSRITLDRALVASTGMTAAAWIRSERLRTAAERLRSNDGSLDLIGTSCGFADLDSFARAFKRQYGCTPRTWRSRQATRRN